jgi:hypothetical protein
MERRITKYVCRKESMNLILKSVVSSLCGGRVKVRLSGKIKADGI